jgi:hypothetical protein
VFGGVEGGGACGCASRVAAIHGADAQGGGSIEAGADDNAPYDFRTLFEEAGHNVGYQPTLPIFSLAAPDHWRKPSAWVNCRGWQGETKDLFKNNFTVFGKYGENRPKITLCAAKR